MALEQSIRCSKQQHTVRRDRWLVCIHDRLVTGAREYAAPVSGITGEATCETCSDRIAKNDLGVQKFLRVCCGDCVRERWSIEKLGAQLGLPMEARA